MKVCIVGGGGSAHLLAVLLAGRGHCVTVFTRRPKDWSLDLELQDDCRILRGKILGVTDDPVEALETAEVAVLCLPVHQYPAMLERMLPGLLRNPSCIIGTVYGQGGFDWMIKGFSHRCKINVENYFAVGLLPWIVRTKEYGKSAISYGPKKFNAIACSNDETYEKLAGCLLDDFSMSYWGSGKFVLAENFITLSLTVDNQIIHPSRCYGLLHETAAWSSADAIPYFYRDFDSFSTEVLRGVDCDLTLVRNALVKRFPQIDNPLMLDYLGLEHWSYGSHNPDIQSSFVNSVTLRDIKPPTFCGEDGFWKLDVRHRFFKDDIAFGLDIVKWFADQLHVDVPHIRAIIDWYERDIVPRAGERLTPATPAFYGLTLEEAVLGK